MTTALTIFATQKPGLTYRSSKLEQSETFQIKQAESITPPLIFQVDGILEEGDNTFGENSGWVDAYAFEGQNRLAVTITVISEDFTPVIDVFDYVGDNVNEVIDGRTGNADTVSLTLILPNDGFYGIGVLGTTPDSQGTYQLTVSVASVAEVVQMQAEQLLEQGIQDYEQRLFQEAIASWEQAIEIYQGLESAYGLTELSHRDIAFLFMGLGNAYRHLAQYEKAIIFSEQALQLSRQLNDRVIQNFSLQGLSNAHFRLSQYEEAIAFSEQALELSRQFDDRAGEGDAIGSLGIAHGRLGRYQQA
ncbi:MAG: tetratricopeptide repeat protein, partial [Leptolyngbya sp. SIO1D8]|nr:tetratricopeptide repeat protein [Leptolyngbya sp. SIO1D8]